MAPRLNDGQSVAPGGFGRVPQTGYLFLAQTGGVFGGGAWSHTEPGGEPGGPVAWSPGSYVPTPLGFARFCT